MYYISSYDQRGLWGIKKQETVYYPKRKAGLFAERTGIIYRDSSKSKNLYRAWSKELSLSDRVYYCSRDNHLYFLVITDYTNLRLRRAEAFRMVDFKSNYYMYF